MPRFEAMAKNQFPLLLLLKKFLGLFLQMMGGRLVILGERVRFCGRRLGSMKVCNSDLPRMCQYFLELEWPPELTC